VIETMQASYDARDRMSGIYTQHPPTLGPHPYDEYCVCNTCSG
jgi:hypothetical protein